MIRQSATNGPRARGRIFLWLTVVGPVILAAILTVGFIGEDSLPQLLSTFALVALLAVANWVNHRSRKVEPGEASEDAKQPVLIRLNTPLWPGAPVAVRSMLCEDCC
ncbi:hypothetical protein [Pseudarthrobacter sp. C1]|uniref:hypothetical protein n=1 Tax=Pseudarthrobacter sp. C1 TaxID=3108940 RepID=UPI002B06160C|nr:hypothetical protein [Pseudarthrobacter sp. C1]MEA3549260.1 hypothetical protein [Pseudarthrobacter sp. C1]